MKRSFLLWFLICCLFSVVTQAKILAPTPNEVIVKFKKAPFSVQSFDFLLEDIGASQMYSIQFLPEIKLIRFKDHSLKDVLNILNHHPSVEYAEPNFIISLFNDDDEDDDKEKPPFPWPFPFPPPGDGEFPWPWPPGGGDDDKKAGKDPLPIEPSPFEPQEDPNLESAWGIKKVGSVSAWQITPGSKDVIVGIVDTGIDYNHEDLISNIYRNPKEIPENKLDDDNNGYIDDILGWDFVNNDNLAYDDNMHGTHVGGTIGAVGNNGIGISGINQIVSLLPIKSFDAEGYGETMAAIKGIEYAFLQGAKVINNSWGDYEFSQALVDIIGEAEKKNVVVVCAAGNEMNNNDKNPSYPATVQKENVISTAASTKGDGLAFFSNYGKKTVHLAAPGAGVYSTVPKNKYDSLDGTSMASPHVAGAAALLLSLKPNLTPQEIKALLIETATQKPAFEDKTISGGRLNVKKAIEKVRN